jgi:glycosyltransferase involved in cell wall biosynthesis
MDNNFRSNSLKILFFSGSLPPMKCGVGDYTDRLATALSRSANFNGRIGVVSDRRASDGERDLDFDLMPIADTWRPQDAVEIIRAVRLWKPDILHFQFPGQGYGRRLLPWILPTIFHVLGYKIAQTWHEYYASWKNRGLWKNLPNALLPGGLVVVRPNYIGNMPGFYRQITAHKLTRFIQNASVIPPARLTQEEAIAVREEFAGGSKNVIVFFGFVYPSKGVDLLFEIADPSIDFLVLISELKNDDGYHKEIIRRINKSEWKDHVRITGFLPEMEVAEIIASADAAIFPFTDGGGEWNSSLHAAQDQGTFVLTTSKDRHGYDREHNTFYAKPGDVHELRSALREYIKTKIPVDQSEGQLEWDLIAKKHLELYTAIIEKGS